MIQELKHVLQMRRLQTQHALDPLTKAEISSSPMSTISQQQVRFNILGKDSLVSENKAVKLLPPSNIRVTRQCNQPLPTLPRNPVALEPASVEQRHHRVQT